jgi:hypothetical protein
MQHFLYVVAIKDTRAWQGSTVPELSLIGWWNLLFVWLKLLLPWRFFRLWALLDGIDPPENMVRCVVNNYSCLAFWRSWHRSYNLWIIRYIYIPLGGTGNLWVTSFLIFTFVALWHDLSFRLLAWGLLIPLFILPEIICTTFLVPSSKYGKEWWYRHVCAMGAVGNMLSMVTANLVGFVVGVDGVQYMLGEVFGTWEGAKFMVVSCAAIFVAVQVMFEYRCVFCFYPYLWGGCDDADGATGRRRSGRVFIGDVNLFVNGPNFGYALTPDPAKSTSTSMLKCLTPSETLQRLLMGPNGSVLTTSRTHTSISQWFSATSHRRDEGPTCPPILSDQNCLIW